MIWNLNSKQMDCGRNDEEKDEEQKNQQKEEVFFQHEFVCYANELIKKNVCNKRIIYV